MNFIRLFILRPVATTLLTIGIALAGIFAYAKLPVAPLPQVDFPTIAVRATMAGASPQTMAATVAAPLERHLGQIADVTQMTSTSTPGSTRIVLQFGLSRDINGAARDVEAAIQAARADLPTSLRSNPTYNKVNPADAPIMVLAMTSTTLTRGQVYNAASNVISQALSQINGIGEVDIGGSSLPAVRVELNPHALFKYGVGLEDVRAALAAANADSPKGQITIGAQRYQIYTNDQATQAAQYRNLVIAYRNGAAVHLSDVATVVDSVEDLHNAGMADGKPAVLVILYRQPGANIIGTVDRVRALLPQLQASLPGGVTVTPMVDRTSTIRASLAETQRALLISVGLVILVVFAFLREPRTTLIPCIAVPVSIIGTFAGMWLLGYSLDNLSLMALTISTGFVVDDAIVVLENIARHREAGLSRREAALRGASEVGFTVLSISVSLIAVFLPILLMGGIVGRLFREFAITLSIAIVVSLIVSLTMVPMLASLILPNEAGHAHGRLWHFFERGFRAMQDFYARTLAVALRYAPWVALTLIATVALNVALFVVVPKGFFPLQDTGRMIGGIQADQSISFQSMRQKLSQFMGIIRADPAVSGAVGFTGGRQTNSGFVFIALKPLSQRPPILQVMARLRQKLSRVAGARLFLLPVQDIQVGGRQSNALYQYTLQADDPQTLDTWTPKLADAMRKIKLLTDVNSDLQQGGLEAMVHIDRDAAARFGLTPAMIDNTLYDAFGQRQVSVIYNAQNQYHVVMEVDPRYQQSPQALGQLWVSTAGGSASGSAQTNAPAGTTGNTTSASAIASDSARNAAINAITGRAGSSSGAAVSTSKETLIPLAAVASFGPGRTPLSVNHQGEFVATTISFNLAPGATLGQAETAINQAMLDLGMPATVHGSFAGTAASFQAALNTEPLLIAAALIAVYVVLGILYESYMHPLTILSTLPSAGLGAVLALLVFHIEFSIIALIGVILLIGIVKKNAIMMIDFALIAQREQNLSPRDAIYQASLLRFRPIMMTTSAAFLGALPLAFGSGEGSELRQPLGIAIMGGLVVSQILTLYTTPVVYLYLDRLRSAIRRRLSRPRRGAAPEPQP
ncbi:MAG: efflux RND transporter permease subunit [Rhodospirillales bacterium]|nr:efflux RND transporter permease subunit [Rhodospirillales bacterium]